MSAPDTVPLSHRICNESCMDSSLQEVQSRGWDEVMAKASSINPYME